MASEVDIWKLALSYIRGGNVNSISDNTKQAQECRLHYPILRDQLLENTPWSFAEQIQTLALLTDVVPGWGYVYQYPQDVLLIDRLIADPVIPTGVSIPYQVMNVNDNLVIVTQTPCASIKFRSKVTNTSLFPANFVSALAHLLAANLAISLVSGAIGAQLRSTELQLYNQIIQAAMANNANQQDSVVAESEFITVRDGYDGTEELHGW